MNSLHQRTLPLICVSLCSSTVALSCSAVLATHCPPFWVVLGIVIITFTHHTFILLVGHAETYASPRLHSTRLVIAAYCLTLLWTTILIGAIVFLYFLSAGKVEGADPKAKIWTIILLPSSLVETSISGYIAFSSHRELKKTLYRNKWTWRGGNPAGGLQWSISNA